MRFRDYQEFAIEAVFRYFEQGGEGHPIVAAPTGVGKSIMIGGFIQRVYQRYPGQRIMMLTHVKELIDQNLHKLLTLWPTAPAGVYSAGLGRQDVHCPITYAGIASIVKVIKSFGHIDLVLIDECHLISPKDDTMYGKVMAALKLANPRVRFIGFTATPWRTGQGMLTEGGIFTDICVDMTGRDAFNWFIDQGYLTPLVPKPTGVRLDTSEVRINHGEYNLRQLQDAVDKDDVTYAALRETLEHAEGRNRWLIFAAGVHHAESTSGILNSLGIETTFVHSKMSDGERDKRLRDSRAGRYQAIVNNGILTTGYDDPFIDLIVMLRPTKSVGLWVQMLGRGTRPLYLPGFDLETTEGRLASIQAGGKVDTLVMDFAQNTRSLGPINDPVIPEKKKKRPGGQAPFRVCESCGEECHASLRTCPYCDTPFPVATKIHQGASTLDLIKRGNDTEAPVTEVFKIDKITYSEHRKQDKPPSLKASYFCGLRRFDEWICLEHEGFAKRKAHQWWRERGQGEPPINIQAAFQRLNELREPTSALVWINKKHPEIMSFTYD